VVALAAAIALEAQANGQSPLRQGKTRSPASPPASRIALGPIGEMATAARGGEAGGAYKEAYDPQWGEAKVGYIPAWRARAVFCIGIGIGAMALWLILNAANQL